MNAKHSATTPEHYTPASLLDLLRSITGPFDFDPASCTMAQQAVQAKRYFSYRERGEDALSLDWPVSDGDVIVCNPPGGKHPDGRRLVPAFWEQCVDYAKRGAVVNWIGFSIEQLATLQDIVCPLRFPTVVLRQRLKFDTLARVGSDKSLWADAKDIVKSKGRPSQEDRNAITHLVEQWMTEPLIRIGGDSPTHHNYVTLLGASEDMINRFCRTMSEHGFVTRGNGAETSMNEVINHSEDE